MSQMLKSSGAMAAATLTSRVLGMVREMAYAAFMGNTFVAEWKGCPDEVLKKLGVSAGD